MAHWEKRTLKLRDGHTWTARPGCQVFVADRGAVMFEFPGDWVVVPGAECIKFYDKRPPDDDCCLAVSYLRLPPLDWSKLPLAALVEEAGKTDNRPLYHWGKIVESRRGALETAWREVRLVDSGQTREARSRMCIARKGGIQALLTYDFWESDLEACAKVWDLVLETLDLDQHIEDPQSGPA